ncbi:MAG: DEAD/DEAH box helicase, partial [Flavobacteriales bacterium]|nr:DEAD/DEAH box helicase [Flavobacteriales bacterium]
MDVKAPVEDILKKYWGFQSFRPLQQEIVETAISGRDAIALLPTGGGKSICFQVPAMAMEGVCIVISPLIALMRDQVQNLKKIGIKATAINSSLSRKEIDIALDNAVYGDTKFLYLSPERLKSEVVVERIKK